MAILDKQPVVGWGNIVFFGFGVLISITALLPGSTWLRIGPDGLSIRSLYRTKHLRWTDTSTFFVAIVGGQAMVCWNHASSTSDQTAKRWLSRLLDVADCGLPDTFGHTPQELADLLNHWRTRSLKDPT